jgi:hypothetical protein
MSAMRKTALSCGALLPREILVLQLARDNVSIMIHDEIIRPTAKGRS